MGRKKTARKRVRMKPMRKLLDLLLAALVAIVIICAAFFGFVYYMISQNGPSAKTYSNRIAPKHARSICRALNRYYAAKGSYPSYLNGGWKKEYSISFWGDEWHYHDPLLEEGFLKSYPRYPGYEGPPLFRGDPRAYIYIRNAVTTDDNPLVPFIRLWIMNARDRCITDIPYSAEQTDRDRIYKLKDSYNKALDYLDHGTRLLAAGGVSERIRGGGQYSVMPLKLSKVLDAEGSEFMSYHGRLQQNFGYVRGEDMRGLGLDERSAFFWLYGLPDDEWNRPQGLDVLNAETGELKPDGIPDGIVLLYELRDGKVVKTTRAEDM